MFSSGSVKVRGGSLSSGTTGVQVTIPNGGGVVSLTLSLASFGLSTIIDQVLEARITSTVPTANGTMVITTLSGTSTVVGVSLAAVSGTTLNALVQVLGY